MNFDFPVEIIRRDRTKSASIEVLDGVVNVIVPNSLSEQRIEGLIKSRTAWIRQKLIEQHERVPVKPKEYVNGETFTYLGRNYRLKLDESAKSEVKLKMATWLFLTPKKYRCAKQMSKSRKLWSYGIKSVPMKSFPRRPSDTQLF
jgi:predicted metal-dependent hydrolase